MSTGPAWFYLHGFASSVQSNKARAFVRWGHEHAVPVDALDLRVPSLERLRFSQILAKVRDAIAVQGERGRAVLIGSSLGGLTACRVAEEEPRVCALFLMAPAFRLAERWRRRLGEEAWRAWKDSGRFEVKDHATGQMTFVDHAFVEELALLDEGFPDVRVPTCIVHGTKDETVDIALSREWAKARPHVQLVEVDDDHELATSVPRILEEATRFFRPFGARPAATAG
ncbi:MAG: YqiA/YcfP family alpha/beta fold hydrolase [Labilithrix sp.]